MANRIDCYPEDLQKLKEDDGCAPTRETIMVNLAESYGEEPYIFYLNICGIDKGYEDEYFLDNLEYKTFGCMIDRVNEIKRGCKKILF